MLTSSSREGAGPFCPQLSCGAKAGKWEAAVRVVRSISEGGLLPDLVSYNSGEIIGSSDTSSLLKTISLEHKRQVVLLTLLSCE